MTLSCPHPDRRGFLSLSLALPLAIVLPRGGWADTGRLALDGFDPVSYFAAPEPLQGQADLALRWRGAIWRFANPAHRAAFEADPRAFAPCYDGHCAWSMAQGQLMPGDPRVWAVFGARLYLAHDAAAMTRWMADPARNIAKGERHWAELGRR